MLIPFDEQKLQTSISGLKSLSALPDPTGRFLLKRELDKGLVLTKVTVPIGVIGIIFEARPDAMIQVASLCIKSGNCAVLKGGKESLHTNRLLFSLSYDCALKCGLPPACLLHATEHAQIAELLSFESLVDLLIPRGSNAFVRYIVDHTNIPVMGHAGGVCHIYVDRDADQASALPVILDAKTQYPAACNAVETLLIHRDLASTFRLPNVKGKQRTSPRNQGGHGTASYRGGAEHRLFTERSGCRYLRFAAGKSKQFPGHHGGCRLYDGV